jgi:uncharacterized Tic20 family protein
MSGMHLTCLREQAEILLNASGKYLTPHEKRFYVIFMNETLNTSQGVINNEHATNEPTNDDRMLGMFAHLSIFFGSIFIPLIFWALYQNKSKFVSFHSLQSLFFHLAYTALMVVVVIICAVVGVLGGLISKTGGAPPEMGALQIIIILALGILVFGFIFGSIGYAVYLAINTYKGGMKKYPIIGNIIYKKVYGVS